MDNEQPEIKVPEIDAQQLKEMLGSPEPPFLIDVREDWEVSRGVISGATHIPMNLVSDQMDELPRDRKIVVYCAAGARSYAVAEYLLYQGFKDVINLDGGIMAWAELQSRGG
jgi:rhodanese-related sulfurtransferase